MFQYSFDLTDIVPTLTESASVVVQDEFTACFESAPRKSWNWNIYLLPIWLIGIFLRYCVLFPIRLVEENEKMKKERKKEILDS